MKLITVKQNDYELIDSGRGRKMEKFGPYILSRPDKEALWNKTLGENSWRNIDLEYIRDGANGKWVINKSIQNSWNISYYDLIFLIKPTSFKHVGIFPEQLENWKWMENLINRNITKRKNKIQVLNLFAYTGGATLVCARAGAEVCHVDGSKKATNWARENSKLSKLEEKPIRWIIEDVLLFLKREIKRGRRYDAIIMDPPSFGRGPKDELWKIEKNFLDLIDLCKNILSEDPLFILINGYTAGYSPIVFENNLMQMMKKYKGNIETGELFIKESSSKKLLPSGVFARWSK